MNRPLNVRQDSPGLRDEEKHRKFLATKVQLKIYKAGRGHGKLYFGVSILAVALAVAVLVWERSPVSYETATPVVTVELPGSGECSVGGTFDGAYYLTIQSGCFSNVIPIYQPPRGNGKAKLVSSKTVIDDEYGKPVGISAISWDSNRGKLWGVMANVVYLIDIGDPTVSGNAVATKQFHPNVAGSYFIDGLAYDARDDTLYYSPDSHPNIYHFSLGTGQNPPLGVLMNAVVPKTKEGENGGKAAGLAIGADDTLYIGVNNDPGIRRIDNITGALISQFFTPGGRLGDLTCNPNGYGAQGKGAIIAKDVFNGRYKAFEVEEGTCRN